MGDLVVRDISEVGCWLFFSNYRCDSDVQVDDIGEKKEDERTIDVIARTEWGQMIDFLRQNPFVTREEYMWVWTVPQIKLALYDFTHIVYLSEEQVKMRNGKKLDESSLISDLGVPLFK